MPGIGKDFDFIGHGRAVSDALEDPIPVIMLIIGAMLNSVTAFAHFARVDKPFSIFTGQTKLTKAKSCRDE